MNEQEKLLNALREGRDEPWRSAASDALRDPGVEYSGKVPYGRNSAGQLRRIYANRLVHCQRSGIAATGISELVEQLAALPGQALIGLQPFTGPNSAIVAFWDADDALVGCVTIMGIDREAGRKNLSFALGEEH